MSVIIFGSRQSVNDKNDIATYLWFIYDIFMTVLYDPKDSIEQLLAMGLGLRAIALQAKISKRTIQRIKGGGGCQLSTARSLALLVETMRGQARHEGISTT